MRTRGALLVLVALLVGQASAESPSVVAFPREYRTSLVKYAIVDRVDGLSRDLYASRDVIEALKRDPPSTELAVGALLALDVHSARQLGRDPRTGTPRFARTREGRLLRSKDERTLHVMQKTQRGFGSQTWVFDGFDPKTTEPLKLQLPGDCLLCHQAALVHEMTFSMSLLKRFAASGEVQYRFCPQPGRQPCPFP